MEVSATTTAYEVIDQKVISMNNTSLCPWLANQCANWETGRFTNVSFTYETGCSTLTGGSVYIGLQYDAKEAYPADAVAMTQTVPMMSCALWENGRCRADARKLNNIGKTKFIGAPRTEEELLAQVNSVEGVGFGGRVIVATEGVPAASLGVVLGYLWIEYTVRLSVPDHTHNPRLPLPALVSAPLSNKTYPFGQSSGPDVPVIPERGISGLTFTINDSPAAGFFTSQVKFDIPDKYYLFQVQINGTTGDFTAHTHPGIEASAHLEYKRTKFLSDNSAVNSTYGMYTLLVKVLKREDGGPSFQNPGTMFVWHNPFCGVNTTHVISRVLEIDAHTYDWWVTQSGILCPPTPEYKIDQWALSRAFMKEGANGGSAMDTALEWCKTPIKLRSYERLAHQLSQGSARTFSKHAAERIIRGVAGHVDPADVKMGPAIRTGDEGTPDGVTPDTAHTGWVMARASQVFGRAGEPPTPTG